MTRRILITKAALHANPQADWNAFIELIATTKFEDLAPSQKPAALVFLYESEVQNGGHLQYFTNIGAERVNAAIESLDELGAINQARILERAAAKWAAAGRLLPADKLEYAAIENEREFAGFDREFHDCPVPLISVLRQHFADYRSCYVVFK